MKRMKVIKGDFKRKYGYLLWFDISISYLDKDYKKFLKHLDASGWIRVIDRKTPVYYTQIAPEIYGFAIKELQYLMQDDWKIVMLPITMTEAVLLGKYSDTRFIK